MTFYFLDINFFSFLEPSNYQGLEGCATVYPNAINQRNSDLFFQKKLLRDKLYWVVNSYLGFGQWNDANCGIKKNGYACKKLKNGETTTPKPTDTPKGYVKITEKMKELISKC
jgi:hypothetical protein